MSTNHAQRERAELCDLMVELGPDVETLCEGWTARDLAAHLVVRERRPDAALGILARPFERHGEKVRLQYAAKDWPELVDLVRSGPPTLSPFGLPGVDQLANTMEYYIHHEDVRRASDLGARDLDPDFEDALWKVLERMSKLFLRRAPARVELTAPDGRIAAGGSGDLVTVRGPVGELALFVYGRQDHAQVELDGPAEAVEAVRTASFGV